MRPCGAYRYSPAGRAAPDGPWSPEGRCEAPREDNLPMCRAHARAAEMPRDGQSQASLTDQLESLYVLANRWGYYDAADFIRRSLDRASNHELA